MTGNLVTAPRRLRFAPEPEQSFPPPEDAVPSARGQGRAHRLLLIKKKKDVF